MCAEDLPVAGQCQLREEVGKRKKTGEDSLER